MRMQIVQNHRICSSIHVGWMREIFLYLSKRIPSWHWLASVKAGIRNRSSGKRCTMVRTIPFLVFLLICLAGFFVADPFQLGSADKSGCWSTFTESVSGCIGIARNQKRGKCVINTIMWTWYDAMQCTIAAVWCGPVRWMCYCGTHTAWAPAPRLSRVLTDILWSRKLY